MGISRKLVKKSKRTMKSKSKSLSRYYMEGGGYNSILNVSKPIQMILNTSIHNWDTTLLFTVINTENSETIVYSNIRCLGEGTYGKVFLVENDGHLYVIKINQKYATYLMDEPRVLDIIMKEVIPTCKYTAISQGLNPIEGSEIGHIIFPYKGSENLYDINEDDTKIELIPGILRDVLGCLININNYGANGDLKLDNIVYDELNSRGSIIDFGLAISFPITINTLYNANVGSKQLSIEIIFGYFFRFIRGTPHLINELYDDKLDIIQRTIDNFGLFWVILESLCPISIRDYIDTRDEYLTRTRDHEIFDNFLNFYFNLNSRTTPLTLILQTHFNYKHKPTFRVDFIQNIHDSIPDEKYILYFENDYNKFLSFINNVIDLVAIDPTERIPKEILLTDPFFQ
jgi:serine/threonine protein kinase